MTKPASLLSREEVERRTSLTRGAIYERLRRGAFPAPVKLGARQRAWLESEIDAWILERAAEREGFEICWVRHDGGRIQGGDPIRVNCAEGHMAPIARIDFAALMPAVTRALLGEPNARMSTARELRYGSRGSLSVHLDKGTWCCFSLSLVGSPRKLAGLFRRRIAWDDGAIREPAGVGEVA